MKSSVILMALVPPFILLGCSSPKDTQDFSDTVASIDEVPPTPTDEFKISEEIIDQIEPDKVQGLTPQGLLSWAPDGTRGRESESECRLARLHQLLKSTPDENPKFFALQIQAYFDRCEKSLSRGTGVGLLQDLRLATVRYKVADSPYIKEIEVKFHNGYKVRGLLALKPDNKKRPLIIARCGVFCDVTDAFPRTILMHLFDESPFNVLVLSSTTGDMFASDNKEFGIGGYLEASQHLRLAEFLLSGGFGLADRISSIHHFGGSLGGNSAVLTALLADKNRNTDGQPLIQSTWAHCPVVNLKDTLETVLTPSVRGYFMAKSASRILSTVFSRRGLDFGKARGPAAILNLIRQEAHSSYARYFAPLEQRFSPFKPMEFKSIDDVWAANQFVDYATSVQIPLIAFAANDDWIVPTDINTETLEHTLTRSNNHNIATVREPQGRHCAQALVYGWSTMSEIYRSYFLKHSPEFLANETTVVQNLEAADLPSRLRSLGPKEFHYSQTWSIDRNSDHFDLTFKIWSPNGRIKCEQEGPYTAPEACFRRTAIQIPLTRFANESFIRSPQTAAESEALTRWANSNVRVNAQDGQELEHLNAQPGGFSWLTY